MFCTPPPSEERQIKAWVGEDGKWVPFEQSRMFDEAMKKAVKEYKFEDNSLASFKENVTLDSKVSIAIVINRIQKTGERRLLNKIDKNFLEYLQGLEQEEFDHHEFRIEK